MILFQHSHASLAAFLFTFCKQSGETCFFLNTQLVSFENQLEREHSVRLFLSSTVCCLYAAKPKQHGWLNVRSTPINV
jgi:hypothetical protein